MSVENDLKLLLCEVDTVLRDALDRVEVHPCDENNDEVKANGLIDAMRNLYKVRHSIIGHNPYQPHNRSKQWKIKSFTDGIG